MSAYFSAGCFPSGTTRTLQSSNAASIASHEARRMVRRLEYDLRNVSSFSAFSRRVCSSKVRSVVLAGFTSTVPSLLTVGCRLILRIEFHYFLLCDFVAQIGD